MIWPKRKKNLTFLLIIYSKEHLLYTSINMHKYSKEIKQVSPKRNQPWLFIGRTDTKAEAPILWPPDVKSWLTGKDPDAGKGWGQEEKGTTEDEMVGWHHWLQGHEFEHTSGDREGQGSLAALHGVAKNRTRLSDWTKYMLQRYQHIYCK